jgi:hypothetical protein
LDNVAKDIETNGKVLENNQKGLEMAHVIPIINRQQAFLTWQPYEELGRKVFFDLFSQ